jgi:hypothetical protein
VPLLSSHKTAYLIIKMCIPFKRLVQEIHMGYFPEIEEDAVDNDQLSLSTATINKAWSSTHMSTHSFVSQGICANFF